jgi:hypothetical protein
MAPELHFLADIMGFTRPIDNAILQFEADEPRAFGSSSLFLVPTLSSRQEHKTIPFHAPPSTKRGVLISMPAHQTSAGRDSRPYVKPSSRFRGDALQYWPRGYPSHDDL